MKYGLLIHKPTTNIGDDIQSYAIERFLPHIDYLMNREELNSFESKGHEPVATIMAAWWMWKKWNWPPSNDILPYFAGFHYSDNDKAKQAGCPAGYDFLTGLGADYLNAYGPIGCRDYFTEKHLKENGVDAYFSGCITITLPQMPHRDHEREYVCLVDVTPAVEAKVREDLVGTDIEVKVITHELDASVNKELPWEERSRNAEELLTLYQNAKCVLTRRLHCALPCLAMGVPVLLTIHTLESIRFIPYYDWLYCCKPGQYAKGTFEYDVKNPPANKTQHMETRHALTESVKDFVAKTSAADDPDSLRKFNASHEEIANWRNSMMLKTSDIWEEDNRKNKAEIAALQGEYNKICPSDVKLSFLRNQKRKLKQILNRSSNEQDFKKAMRGKSINEQNVILENRMRKDLSRMRKDYETIKGLRSSIKKASKKIK